MKSSQLIPSAEVQGRLPQELRLAEVTTVEQASATMAKADISRATKSGHIQKLTTGPLLGCPEMLSDLAPQRAVARDTIREALAIRKEACQQRNLCPHP